MPLAAIIIVVGLSLALQIAGSVCVIRWLISWTGSGLFIGTLVFLGLSGAALAFAAFVLAGRADDVIDKFADDFEANRAGEHSGQVVFALSMVPSDSSEPASVWFWENCSEAD